MEESHTEDVLERLQILVAQYNQGYAGVGLTLTSIHDNYWIPQGREVVKSFIQCCVVCTKYCW